MRRSSYLLWVALAAACTRPAVEAPAWQPGTVLRTPQAPNARGFLDRRGLVHAHSYYSHDACDGQPQLPDGGYDLQCYQDFRDGLCAVGHDFVFLTDHRGSFADHEFPDVLLYREDLGDTLVAHGAGPTANRLACPSGPPALVMAGTETNPMMPVGLERHAADAATRGGLYGTDGAAAILAMKDVGAVALVAHTEGWTVDQLTTLPLDGFEMFNLHASTFKNLSVVADLVLNRIEKGDFDGLPHPDLFLLYFALEDPAYLETWGSVFATGTRRVTTMGTDCHRNSLPQPMADGERVDSYRRMMAGFSNHLLVRPQADGSFDDRDLKDALRSGRLYGSFDFLGYPQGFAFVGREGEATKEMGEEVHLSQSPTLVVTLPTVEALAKDAEAPTIRARILRARDGGWDEVAAGDGAELSFPPTEPGAYRAEVRIVPAHLKAYAGRRLDLVRTERPWVYSNALYVVP